MDDLVARDVTRDRIAGSPTGGRSLGRLREKIPRHRWPTRIGEGIGGAVVVAFGVGVALSGGLIENVLGVMIVLSGIGIIARAV